MEELQGKYCLTSEQQKKKDEYVKKVKRILSGKDSRKIVIVGPCSADREDAVVDYVTRLAGVSEKVKDKLLIIPRVYTSKPRTTGTGYKGMLHNPTGTDNEDLIQGIYKARMLHLEVIRNTDFFPADEMLYPEEIYYVQDILAYMAVGARSVEDQGHRMVASDDAIPVGLKNPLGGSKISLVNSIIAAQAKHKMIYRGWEVETNGNPYAHGVLRGFTNKSGKNYPNYHYEDLRELHDLCIKNNIVNPAVIVDCNHANSDKKYDEQPRIVKETTNSCRVSREINRFVKGWMIESYIEDGSQKVGNGIYGKSITDPCLGWEKTERLLLEMADLL